MAYLSHVGQNTAATNAEKLDFVVSMTNLTWPAIAAISGGFQTLTGVGMRTSQQLNANFTQSQGAILAAGGIASLALFDMTQKAMEFNREMALVKGLIGDISNREMAQLSASARKLAVDFGEAPAEIARGFQMIARAGINNSADQIRVLTNGMRLAKVEGMDVADAVKEVITATTLFGDSYTNVERYASAIAHAANISVTSAKQIGEALKYVGGGAKEHWSVEETLAAIATLSQKGVEGSTAGISIRSFMVYILREMPKSQKALSQLGMTFDDFWEKASNGQRIRLKPLQEIIQTMSEAMYSKGLGRGDMMRVLAQFGEPRMMQQYMKLFPTQEEMQNGTWLLSQFNSEMQKTYDMQERLQNVLSSTQEKWNQMMSAIQSAEISVAEGTLPVLSATTDVVKGLSLSLANNKVAAMGLATGLSAVALAAGILVLAWGKGAAMYLFGNAAAKVKNTLGSLTGTIQTVNKVTKESSFAKMAKDMEQLERKGKSLSGLFSKGSEAIYGKYEPPEEAASLFKTYGITMTPELEKEMLGRNLGMYQTLSEKGVIRKGLSLEEAHGRAEYALAMSDQTSEIGQLRTEMLGIDKHQRTISKKIEQDSKYNYVPARQKVEQDFGKFEGPRLADHHRGQMMEFFGLEKRTSNLLHDRVMNMTKKQIAAMDTSDPSIARAKKGIIAYQKVFAESPESQKWLHAQTFLRGTGQQQSWKYSAGQDRKKLAEREIEYMDLEEKLKKETSEYLPSDIKPKNVEGMIKKLRVQQDLASANMIAVERLLEQQNLGQGVFADNLTGNIKRGEIKKYKDILSGETYSKFEELLLHTEKTPETGAKLAKELEKEKLVATNAHAEFTRLLAEYESAYTKDRAFRYTVYDKFKDVINKWGTLGDRYPATKAIKATNLTKIVNQFGKAADSRMKALFAPYKQIFDGTIEKSLATRFKSLDKPWEFASSFSTQNARVFASNFQGLKEDLKNLPTQVKDARQAIIDIPIRRQLLLDRQVAKNLVYKHFKGNPNDKSIKKRLGFYETSVDFTKTRLAGSGEWKGLKEILDQRVEQRYDQIGKNLSIYERAELTRLQRYLDRLIAPKKALQKQFSENKDLGKFYGLYQQFLAPHDFAIGKQSEKLLNKMKEFGGEKSRLPPAVPGLSQKIDNLGSWMYELDMEMAEFVRKGKKLKSPKDQQIYREMLADKEDAKNRIQDLYKQIAVAYRNEAKRQDVKQSGSMLKENTLAQKSRKGKQGEILAQEELSRIDSVLGQEYSGYKEGSTDKKIRSYYQRVFGEKYLGITDYFKGSGKAIPSSENKNKESFTLGQWIEYTKYELKQRKKLLEDYSEKLGKVEKLEEELGRFGKGISGKTVKGEQKRINELGKSIAEKKRALHEQKLYLTREVEIQKITEELYSDPGSTVKSAQIVRGYLEMQYRNLLKNKAVRAITSRLPEGVLKDPGPAFNNFEKGINKYFATLEKHFDRINQSIVGQKIKTINQAGGLSAYLFGKKETVNIPGSRSEQISWPNLLKRKYFENIGSVRTGRDKMVDAIFGESKWGASAKQFMSLNFLKEFKEGLIPATGRLASLSESLGALSLGSIPLFGAAIVLGAAALFGIITWWTKWNQSMEIATKKLDNYKKQQSALEQQEDQLLSKRKGTKEGSPEYDTLTKELGKTRGDLNVVYDRMSGVNREIFELRSSNWMQYSPIIRKEQGPSWYKGNALDQATKALNPASWVSGEMIARVTGAEAPSKNAWLTGPREQMMAEAYQVEEQRTQRLKALNASQDSQMAMLDKQYARGSIDKPTYEKQRAKGFETYADKMTKLNRSFDRQLAPIVGPSNVEATKQLYQAEQQAKTQRLLLANAAFKLVGAIFALISAITLPLRLLGIGGDGAYAPSTEEGQQPGEQNISTSITDMVAEMQKSISKIEEVKEAINNMANGILYELYKMTYTLDLIRGIADFATSPTKWMSSTVKAPRLDAESYETWVGKNKLGLEHRKPYYPEGETGAKDAERKKKLAGGTVDPATLLVSGEITPEQAQKIYEANKAKKAKALGQYDNTLGMPKPSEVDGKIKTPWGGQLENPTTDSLPQGLPAQKVDTGIGGAGPEYNDTVGAPQIAGTTGGEATPAGVQPSDASSQMGSSIGMAAGMMLPPGADVLGGIIKDRTTQTSIPDELSDVPNIGGAGFAGGSMPSGEGTWDEKPSSKKPFDEKMPEIIDSLRPPRPGDLIGRGESFGSKDLPGPLGHVKMPSIKNIFGKEPTHPQYRFKKGPAPPPEPNFVDKIVAGLQKAWSGLRTKINAPKPEPTLEDEIKKAKEKDSPSAIGNIVRQVIPILAGGALIHLLLMKMKGGPGGLGGLARGLGDFGLQAGKSLWNDGLKGTLGKLPSVLKNAIKDGFALGQVNVGAAKDFGASSIDFVSLKEQIDQLFGWSEARKKVQEKIATFGKEVLGTDEMKADVGKLRTKAQDFAMNNNGYRDEVIQQIGNKTGKVSSKLKAVGEKTGLTEFGRDIKGVGGRVLGDIGSRIGIPEGFAGGLGEKATGIYGSLKQGNLLPRLGTKVGKALPSLSNIPKKEIEAALNGDHLALGNFRGKYGMTPQQAMSRRTLYGKAKAFAKDEEYRGQVIGDTKKLAKSTAWNAKYYAGRGRDAIMGKDVVLPGGKTFRQEGILEKVQNYDYSTKYDNLKNSIMGRDIVLPGGKTFRQEGIRERIQNYDYKNFGGEHGQALRDSLFGKTVTAPGGATIQKQGLLGKMGEAFGEQKSNLASYLQENGEEGGITNTLGSILDGASGLGDLKDILGTKGSKALGKAGKFMGKMGGKAGKLMGKAGGALGKIGGKAGGLLGKAGGALGKMGGKAGGLLGKAGGALGKMGGKAGGMLGKVGGKGLGKAAKMGKSLLKKIPGIGSIASGVDLVSGLLSGTATPGEILGNVAGLIPGVGTIGSIIGDVAGAGLDAVTGGAPVGEMVKGAGGKAASAASGVGQGILQGINSLVSGQLAQTGEIKGQRKDGKKGFGLGALGAMTPWGALGKAWDMLTPKGEKFRFKKHSPFTVWRGQSGSLPGGSGGSFSVRFPELDSEKFKKMAVETGQQLGGQGNGVNVTLQPGAITIVSSDAEEIQQLVYNAIVKAARDIKAGS